MTTAVVCLAQTIFQQERSQSEWPALHKSNIEFTQNSDWLVFMGLAGLAFFLGLAIFNSKRRKDMNKDNDSDNDMNKDDDFDNENYFG